MKSYVKSHGYLIPAVLLFAMQPTVAFAESLEDAVRAAVTAHPSVETAKASADAAGQERREYRSNYFPKLAVGASAGRVYGDNATSRGLSVTRGAGYSNLWRGNVAATETIFDGFKTSNLVKSATARKASADFTVFDTRETAAYRAAQAYIDLLRAQEGLAMLRGHGKKVDDYVARIKKAVDDGGSDEAEHQQARDIRVILNGLISDYEGQVRAAQSNYFNMTGHLPNSLAKPEIPVGFVVKDVEEALAAAHEHHPALRAAQHDSASSSYDIKAEKASLYPDVEGELSYLMEEKDDLIGGEMEDGRAVVNLNWEFETGGAQLARIKRKKFEHAQALSRAQETQKQIDLGVRLAWSEYETAKEQLGNQQKRGELNEKLFSTYKIQFEGAKISQLQLMQGDNQRFTTELEKLNGRYRLLDSEFALLSSMGMLQKALNITEDVPVASAAPLPEAKPVKEAKKNPAEATVEPAAGDCGAPQCGMLTRP